MTVARIVLEDYPNTVLNVVKAKYGLKDKSEAINRFLNDYGCNEVEPQVKESYVKKILSMREEHYRKHANRKMDDKELDGLFGK